MKMLGKRKCILFYLNLPSKLSSRLKKRKKAESNAIIFWEQVGTEGLGWDEMEPLEDKEVWEVLKTLRTTLLVIQWFWKEFDLEILLAFSLEVFEFVSVLGL